MRPSVRSTFIFPSVNADIYTSIVENTNRMKSVVLKPIISNGEINDEIPRISKTLNMFEPITLPSASCGLPFRAAMLLVTSSGKDVPIATIVKDITASLIPQFLARITDESRNRLPPQSNTPRETAAMDIVIHSGLPERELVADSSYSS